jgi:thioredoxin-like negative regulator of GroEL
VYGLQDEFGRRVNVQIIDTDDPANRRLVSQYGARAIPHMVIFNDVGQVSSVWRGLTGASTLRRAINKALDESVETE